MWLKSFLLLALLAVPVTVRGNNDDAGAIVTLTARLVEIPTTLPPDDLYDYAYVMRYQVVGGAMDKASIRVAHYKPRQPRAKIKDSMKGSVGGKLRSFN